MRALTTGGWGDAPDRITQSLPGGATLFEGGTSRGWVLVDDGDPRGLGAALAWARQQHVDELHLLVDTAPSRDAAGVIARRAAQLAHPPSVIAVHGRDLSEAAPEPPVPERPAPAGALAFVDALAAHGVDPVVEHGVVTGEILGLEVARIVEDDAAWDAVALPADDPMADEAAGEPAWRLEVGVGRHDREARAVMRLGQDAFDALDEAAAEVRAWRTSAAGRHPANTLARERWLRAVVIARPDLAGAARLAPLSPIAPRVDLRRPEPAPAAGTDGDGREIVVVCSTGVDIDLVPNAADVRASHLPEAQLVLVVPEGDDYPVTRSLAAALASPADIVTVPVDWAGIDPGARPLGDRR